MPAGGKDAMSAVLDRNSDAILDDWVKRQLQATTARMDLINEAELRDESKRFLASFKRGLASGNRSNIDKDDWADAVDLLGNLSRSRALQGFSPSETATFVFSLKEPLFASLRAALKDEPEQLANEMWSATTLLDKLGLYTT